MSKIAARNRSFLGTRQIKVGDRKFALDWGAHRTTIAEGEKKISFNNRVMADKLGHMKIEDFIVREFGRAA